MTDINERAVIGGNSPPSPFAAHEAHIGDLLELASGALTGGAIDTPEKATQVDELLDDIKKAESALEATRKAEKKPWDDGAAAVQAAVKPLAAKLAVAKKDSAGCSHALPAGRTS